MADLGAFRCHRGAIVDRLHIRRLLQRPLSGAASTTLVSVGAAGAQRLLGRRGDQTAVDGFVDL
jgi:hypothetical protein